MQIKQQTIGLVVDGSLMRLHLAMPVGDGPWPGVLFFSDIYQLGAPMIRLANRLAGYGYVVAAPEIFHRTEVVGTVIEPDDIGRLRGNDNARRTAINAYDADAEATVPGCRRNHRFSQSTWVVLASASAAISPFELRCSLS